jgi:hypothetical protein
MVAELFPAGPLRTASRFVRLALLATVFSGFELPASAQTPPEKPDPQKTPSGQPTDAGKKADEFAEAARVLNGPAGQPECLWLGRRVVNLLWRDDLDTAFRHFHLYDRFGCPAGHVQVTFRCVVRQGQMDPKSPETLAARVHACWINPELPAQTTQAQPTAQPQPPGNPAQ